MATVCGEMGSRVSSRKRAPPRSVYRMPHPTFLYKLSREARPTTLKKNVNPEGIEVHAAGPGKKRSRVESRFPRQFLWRSAGAGELLRLLDRLCRIHPNGTALRARWSWYFRRTIPTDLAGS